MKNRASATGWQFGQQFLRKSRNKNLGWSFSTKQRQHMSIFYKIFHFWPLKLVIRCNLKHGIKPKIECYTFKSKFLWFIFIFIFQFIMFSYFQNWNNLVQFSCMLVLSQLTCMHTDAYNLFSWDNIHHCKFIRKIVASAKKSSK